MNENMKDFGMPYPHFPEGVENDEVLEQREMDVKETEDEILGEQDFIINGGDFGTVSVEKEFSVNMDEYFEEEFEEECAFVPVEETDDYEFMPDVNFDIYNAE